MSPAPHTPAQGPSRAVERWLLVTYAMVMLLVAVGGITRLTGSGLSITEWRPIMGALPPMSHAEWERAFALYRETPQARLENAWMTMSDFQGIFFWEYLHRLLARLLGVVFAVPAAYFVWRGELRGRWLGRAGVALALGGAQGLMGWLMVASGLVDEPRVSPYRLAAHLGLAFVIGHYLLWLALERRAERRGPPTLGAARGERWVALAYLALVALQVVFGALMAGSRAGHMYATFPDMHGAYVVTGVDYWRDPAGIHFVHRTLGWAVTLGALATAAYWRLAARARAELGGRSVVAAWATPALVGVALAQLALGAFTVLSHVRPPIAVAHQLGAWLVVSTLVSALHGMRRPRSATARPDAHTRVGPQGLDAAA
jgi:cytochrome c oxidase assembly protein subunit 15